MASKETSNKLTKLVKQVEDLRRKMQQDGQIALKEAFSDFFDAHPEATAIVWTQYTPYFNDGDACTFGINYFELKVDVNKVADDIKFLLDKSGHNDEYDWGGGCAARSISRIEDTAANRKLKKDNHYYNDLYKDLTLRQLELKEKSLLEDFKELTNSCHAIPEILETILGDHIKVTATKKGFSIDDYSHD
jgi:hypothetical protein